MDDFMRAAFEEARSGAEEGGVPIDAALVDGDTLVATGHNRRLQDTAPVMHAEINCLYNAGKTIRDFSSKTLYSTLMPRYMCAGAVLQFGITKVVTAESKTANEGLEIMVRHGVEVINSDMDEAKSMLGEVIRTNPHQWHSHAPK